MKQPLVNIAEIKAGFQTREGIVADSSGSHFLIQARDFDKQRQIQWSGLIRFNPRGDVGRYELKRDDVLFLARGQENFAYCVERDLDATLATNTFYILRANRKIILPSYLTWWLNQTPAQDDIKLQRSGSAIQFISVAALACLEISVPNFDIQCKILGVEELRKQEIELTNALLKKKSTLIQALCLNAIRE